MEEQMNLYDDAICRKLQNFIICFRPKGLGIKPFYIKKNERR